MGAPKPTLGYPSRTEAALALRAQGLSTGQICEAIGIKPNALSGLEHHAVKSPIGRAPRPAEENGRTVLIPIDILKRLRRHAITRGISVNELCRRLLDVAGEENLVDGILDDAQDRNPS